MFNATTLLTFVMFTVSAAQASWEWTTDRPGSDYYSFDQSDTDPLTCYNACQNDSRCIAWTYVKPGVQGHNARCWLKNQVPSARGSDCCISGVKNWGVWKSRWDKVSGPGASWTTGWVENHPGAICGAYARDCACGSENYCGVHPDGAYVKWWPNGCGGQEWLMKCTSIPQ